MSEYQYYEFQAVDRPLGSKQMGELRRISSRAEITPHSFVNVYNYGDFHGDPAKLVAQYFDAFLYLANWGIRTCRPRFDSGPLATYGALHSSRLLRAGPPPSSLSAPATWAKPEGRRRLLSARVRRPGRSVEQRPRGRSTSNRSWDRRCASGPRSMS